MDKALIALIAAFTIFINYISSILFGYGAGIVVYQKVDEAGIGIGIVTNFSNFEGYPVYTFKFRTTGQEEISGPGGI